MQVTHMLGEGATFHYLPTDKFTTDYFSVHFILPLSAETVSGYSLLTKLFKKGCSSYPTQELLAKRLEELYSASLGISVSKQGERQMISVGMETLSSRFIFDGAPVFEDAFRLLCEVITSPYLENGVFSSASVEREKKALTAQLRATVNDKRKYAMKRCREIMCDGERYSLALEGTEEGIAACTPKSLYALYLQMLREATLEIFYIGRESESTARAYAEQLLLRLGTRAPVSQPTEIKTRAISEKHVEETVDAVQGKLAIGFRTGLSETTTQKQKDAILLMNLLYGTSPLSKLFMNVREKLSLCYYCASRNDSQKGVLFVQSGVENENAEKALAEILLQLSELRKGNITDDEMLCAKQAFRDLTRSVADSPYLLEQWYLTRTLQGDHRTPEQINTEIERLTVADVADAAQCMTLDTVFFLKGTARKEHIDENV